MVKFKSEIGFDMNGCRACVCAVHLCVCMLPEHFVCVCTRTSHVCTACGRWTMSHIPRKVENHLSLLATVCMLGIKPSRRAASTQPLPHLSSLWLIP